MNNQFVFRRESRARRFFNRLAARIVFGLAFSITTFVVVAYLFPVTLLLAVMAIGEIRLSFR